MDIQKQLESLPRESWQRVRNFLREGYVPITRAEADELYYKGFDYTVALVEMRGPVDSVGNEGVFMKPLSHCSYGGKRYDGTYQYFKDAIAKYHEAAKRFQEAIPQTTREHTAPESEESEVWKLKAAEPDAQFERRGLKDSQKSANIQDGWNTLPIDDTIRNHWKKKVEEQYERDRDTGKDTIAGGRVANDSRNIGDEQLSLPSGTELGRLLEQQIQKTRGKADSRWLESAVLDPVSYQHLMLQRI